MCYLNFCLMFNLRQILVSFLLNTQLYFHYSGAAAQIVLRLNTIIICQFVVTVYKNTINCVLKIFILHTLAH